MSSESRENLIDPRLNGKKPVTILQLFRYTSSGDRLLLALGSVLAVVSGFGKPLYAGILGHVSQSFVNFTNEIAHLNATDPEREKLFEQFHHQVAFLCLLYLLLAIGTFLAASIQEICFVRVSENTVNHLRQLFVSSILKQDIAWFDSQNGGALATTVLSNIDKIKEGTGSHFGLSIQTISLFISGFAVCFYHDWRLCLVGTCLTPLTGITGYLASKKMSKLGKEEQERSTEAGGIAQQALSSMRTVMCFNGQEQECKRYKLILERVKASGIHFARWNGLHMGLSEFVLFLSYCITVYTGTNLVYDGTIKPGVVITVFITVMLCVYQLQIVAPLMTRINQAKVSAEPVYNVINRKSEAAPSLGKKPDGPGHIRLENLHFQYPSRKGVPVLKGITMDIEPGQTVALVGASGSGKSTIVQLLLKFYDPISGRILLDGVDIDQWDLQHLRKTIAVVSQEPKLFNTTIEENIRFGRENITEKEIWKVLKKANAQEFVRAFPKGLKTVVGDRGTQLSGGQKQRIAIARALARDPKILLLDEATSALDSESETIVQQALENASEGRTTLVIAHRLSTVRNADKIAAMRAGEVVEVGTHDQLMEQKGLYYELVNNQIFVDVEEEPAPRRISHFTTSLSSDTGPQEFLRMVSTITGETVDEEAIVVDVTRKRLEKELKEEGASQSSIRRILREVGPDWKLLLLAIFVALGEGFIFPAYTFAFTELIKTFSLSDKEQMLHLGHSYAFFFLFLGVCYCFTQLVNISLFGIVAERLAFKLRSKIFKNLMRQDAAYYDKEIHSPGILLTRLASDANNIKPAVNVKLGMALALCTIDLVSYSASIYFGWQMALVAIPVFAPVYIAFGLKSKFLRRKALQDEKEMEDCGRISMEALNNIRTVKALTMETKVHENFCHHLEVPIKNGRQRSLVQGVAFGTTNAIHFFMNSICFRAGLFLVYHQYLEPQAMLRSLFMVTFTSFSLGAILNYTPEYVKAKMAAGLLFKMMDEEPKIDGMSAEGKKPEIRGNIEIKDLHFRYPERENVEVLKGLDLTIKEGETVALVGASGCGKSTVCSLLERLYDPEEGTIELDGHNIGEMNPSHLRAQISIVSQEPVLFDMTIRENILYGLAEREQSREKMIEAAKKAQIHEVISHLPGGYETSVGDQGAQLSGGQKQRIAIARALVRNPKILILDEATSALDTESEKLVQLALEEASRDRSCLVVAHRLSTIRNAHQILVFHQGRVVESGTHDQLLQKKGIYFSLQKKQTAAG